MAEPWSDDPGEDAHWDGRSRPYGQDLGEGVLPYGCIPVNFLIANRRTVSARDGIAASAIGCATSIWILPLLVECMPRRHAAAAQGTSSKGRTRPQTSR
jgi:hypothetical protein